MFNLVGGAYSKDHELEFQIQLGSKLMPEYPIRSLSESYAQLKKSVGIMGSNFHSMSMTPKQYRNNHCAWNRHGKINWKCVDRNFNKTRRFAYC